MTTWLNLPSHGYTRRWFMLLDGNPSAHEPARRFLAAYSALDSMVQPLGMSFEMACRSEEYPFIERSVWPPHSTWHIRKAEIPAQIEVNARFSTEGHQEIVARHLTIAEIEHWLMAAHHQELESGYLATLYALEMHYTRARVFDRTAEYAQLVDGAVTYTIPIESHEDGRWAAGPIRNTKVNPPIKIKFDNNDGRLTLYVTVGWSPWQVVGAPGEQALSQALQQLTPQGWQPENR